MATSLTRAEVSRIAELARLELTSSELDLFTRQLGDILEYVEQIRGLDTAGVAPTSHVLNRPVEARRHGIEIVHQDLALCDNLTAAANVYLGREPRIGFGPIGILDYATMYKRAGELFKELKSETRPRDLVKQMSGGQRQAVAIARALRLNAELIVMDEPTAALGVMETAQVLDLIRRLKADGKTIILVSHNMADVVAVASRVAIFKQGRKVIDRATAGLDADALAHMVMTGKDGGHP